jgi:3'(2'), 5'-bisphosphate nucleotidase
MNLSQLIDPVVVLATKAGKAILEVYASDFDVQAKDDQTPLTQADMASHHIIVAGLEKLTPDLPILSEESGLPDFGERGQWNPYWLVDPLDGTRCRSGKRPIRAARALARTSGPTANIRNRSA